MTLTLPRLLVTASWICCGALGALLLKGPWGTIGAVVGFILGISGAFLLTWGFLLGRTLLLFPFPPCRQGRCARYKDFTWKRGTIYGRQSDGTYLYRCKCGDQYLREGRRFVAILSDGTRQPYKKLVAFRTWIDDL